MFGIFEPSSNCHLICAGVALFSRLWPGIFAHAAHTQVQLLLSADTARPGDTIWAGVDMKMDPGWHTYWKNPGEAGMATKIEWQLPPGVTAGEIQWPLPEKLPPAEVTTYGYNNEVVLLVPLKLAADLKPGPLDLKANVSWLECKEVCVPGSASVEATLNIGKETKTSADAATIESWKSKVPQPGDSLQAHAWWEKPANGDTRPLIIEWIRAWTQPLTTPIFSPTPMTILKFKPRPKIFPPEPAKFALRKFVQKFSGDWPKEISGVIVMEIGGSAQGFRGQIAHQRPGSGR